MFAALSRPDKISFGSGMLWPHAQTPGYESALVPERRYAL